MQIPRDKPQVKVGEVGVDQLEKHVFIPGECTLAFIDGLSITPMVGLEISSTGNEYIAVYNSIRKDRLKISLNVPKRVLKVQEERDAIIDQCNLAIDDVHKISRDHLIGIIMKIKNIATSGV